MMVAAKGSLAPFLSHLVKTLMAKIGTKTAGKPLILGDHQDTFLYVCDRIAL